MTLEDIRRECSDIAQLLQPYIDGELDQGESDDVAKHLETCHPCRAAVHEQAWVRATLQGLERQPAPQALRAQVLLGLDEVDREAAADAAKGAANPGESRGLWGRVRDRVREMGRGGLIMIPAGAAALGLFVMARQGVLPGDAHVDQPVAAAGFAAEPTAPATPLRAAAEPAKAPADVSELLSSLQPQVSFPVRLPQSGLNTRTGVQLVGARLARQTSPNARPAGIRVDYAVDRDQRHARVVDHQSVATGRAPVGVEVQRNDISYRLVRDAQGAPWVLFEHAGVAHRVGIEGAVPSPAGRTAEPSERDPDFALLLHVAQVLSRGTR